MTVQREPRVGDIYWLKNCVPISGDVAKTRPVVVMTSPEAREVLGGILVAACTSSSYPSDTVAIELPSHPLGSVRSGLRRKTRVVPQWAVMTTREELVDYAGYISGTLLDKLLKAFFSYYGQNPQRAGGERN